MRNQEASEDRRTTTVRDAGPLRRTEKWIHTDFLGIRHVKSLLCKMQATLTQSATVRHQVQLQPLINAGSDLSLKGVERLRRSVIQFKFGIQFILGLHGLSISCADNTNNYFENDHLGIAWWQWDEVSFIGVKSSNSNESLWGWTEGAVLTEGLELPWLHEKNKIKENKNSVIVLESLSKKNCWWTL